MTDGEPVWALVHFKPISTLLHPLRSVDIGTGAEINAHYERSDICVVPAGAVVAEAMLAWVLASATMEKFGGDNLADIPAGPCAPIVALPAAFGDRHSPHRARGSFRNGQEHDRAADRRAAWLERVDLDDEITSSSGRPPGTIIAAEGEPHFRDVELAVLESALRRPGPLVIACGGGLIAQPAARQLLTELCTVVWLDAPDAVLIRRLGDGADRPMLGGSPESGIPHAAKQPGASAPTRPTCASTPTTLPRPSRIV